MRTPHLIVTLGAVIGCFNSACSDGSIDSFSGPRLGAGGAATAGSAGATGGIATSPNAGATSTGGSAASAAGGLMSSGGSGTLPACEPTAQSIHDTIIVPSCTQRSCHGAGQAAAALDLSTTDWTSKLVGVSSSTCDGWARVVPGSPAQSFLYEKISNPMPACGGDRMPSGGVLPDAYVQCVADWITSLGQGSCETCGGSACVSLPTDPNHCGTCDRVCPATAACDSGQCVCPGAQTACGSTCVDLTSDPDDCGSCGNVCAAGATCSAGKCACSGSLSACGTSCVDLGSDAAHCGACGSACAAGEVCSQGKCTSGCGTLMQCGASCVDVQTSVTNCGSCGNACAAGLTCAKGSCGCAAGLNQCGTSCVNLQTDGQNCGMCGTSCGPGSTCSSGQCQCGSTSISFASDVQPIFTAACTAAGCHSGTKPKENLSLVAGKAYDELVGVTSAECSGGRKLVTAADVRQSYLVDKLLGTNLCSGSQMPKAGQSLSAADLAKVSDWICQGAKRN